MSCGGAGGGECVGGEGEPGKVGGGGKGLTGIVGDGEAGWALGRRMSRGGVERADLGQSWRLRMENYIFSRVKQEAGWPFTQAKFSRWLSALSQEEGNQDPVKGGYVTVRLNYLRCLCMTRLIATNSHRGIKRLRNGDAHEYSIYGTSWMKKNAVLEDYQGL